MLAFCLKGSVLEFSEPRWQAFKAVEPGCCMTLFSCSYMQNALLQAMVLNVHALCSGTYNPQWVGGKMLSQGTGLGVKTNLTIQTKFVS